MRFRVRSVKKAGRAIEATRAIKECRDQTHRAPSDQTDYRYPDAVGGRKRYVLRELVTNMRLTQFFFNSSVILHEVLARAHIHLISNTVYNNNNLSLCPLITQRSRRPQRNHTDRRPPQNHRPTITTRVVVVEPVVTRKLVAIMVMSTPTRQTILMIQPGKNNI